MERREDTTDDDIKQAKEKAKSLMKLAPEVFKDDDTDSQQEQATQQQQQQSLSSSDVASLVGNGNDDVVDNKNTQPVVNHNQQIERRSRESVVDGKFRRSKLRTSNQRKGRAPRGHHPIDESEEGGNSAYTTNYEIPSASFVEGSFVSYHRKGRAPRGHHPIIDDSEEGRDFEEDDDMTNSQMPGTDTCRKSHRKERASRLHHPMDESEECGDSEDDSDETPGAFNVEGRNDPSTDGDPVRHTIAVSYDDYIEADSQQNNMDEENPIVDKENLVVAELAPTTVEGTAIAMDKDDEDQPATAYNTRTIKLLLSAIFIGIIGVIVVLVFVFIIKPQNDDKTSATTAPLSNVITSFPTTAASPSAATATTAPSSALPTTEISINEPTGVPNTSSPLVPPTSPSIPFLTPFPSKLPTTPLTPSPTPQPTPLPTRLPTLDSAMSPTTKSPTAPPSPASSTISPTVMPTTKTPTKQPSPPPTTTSPTPSPTTKSPTTAPSPPPPTTSPTVMPTTKAPTKEPSLPPTFSPTQTPPAFGMEQTVIAMLSTYIPDIPSTTVQRQAIDWLIENDGGYVATQQPYFLLERFVLAVMFYTMNGVAWSDDGIVHSDTWLSEGSVCDWLRVNCSGDGKVGDLNLFQDNLSGTVPSEIGTLTALTGFRFRGNALLGSFPTEIGRLTNLERMNLANNELTGVIPSEMGSLTALRTLFLNDNILSGTVPSQLIPLLESLPNCRLFNNRQLTGIPSNCR